jgi:hypothetical protein
MQVNLHINGQPGPIGRAPAQPHLLAAVRTRV